MGSLFCHRSNILWDLTILFQLIVLNLCQETNIVARQF